MAERLVLYFREYCSLCHEMRAALAPWEARGEVSLEIRDVDAREEWVSEFDELVPVLCGEEGEICHYHLDESALTAYLTRSKN